MTGPITGPSPSLHNLKSNPLLNFSLQFDSIPSNVHPKTAASTHFPLLNTQPHASIHLSHIPRSAKAPPVLLHLSEIDLSSFPFHPSTKHHCSEVECKFFTSTSSSFHLQLPKILHSVAKPLPSNTQPCPGILSFRLFTSFHPTATFVVAKSRPCASRLTRASVSLLATNVPVCSTQICQHRDGD